MEDRDEGEGGSLETSPSESKKGLAHKICAFEKKQKRKTTEQVVPPTLINIGSNANYSNIHRCYSIHVH